MGQTHPISVCTGTIHARHVISSRYILLQLEASVFKVTLGKNLIERKSRAFEIAQIQTISTQNVPRVVPFMVKIHILE